MKNTYIDEFEKSQMKDKVEDVRVGDIVVVHKVIVEGKKQRVQRFQGTVIKLKGSLSRKSFTVRKIMDGIGVEKTFLLHSKLVEKVDIVKRSKVRQAKLYYLRDRVGAKANRLKVKSLDVVDETEGKPANSVEPNQNNETNVTEVEESTTQSAEKNAVQDTKSADTQTESSDS